MWRVLSLSDLIFKNQAMSTRDKDKEPQFVNDLLRTEFHKCVFTSAVCLSPGRTHECCRKFMSKFIKVCYTLSTFAGRADGVSLNRTVTDYAVLLLCIIGCFPGTFYSAVHARGCPPNTFTVALCYIVFTRAQDKVRLDAPWQ